MSHEINLQAVLALTLLYASFVTVGAPMVLRRGTWWLRRPRLALSLWWMAFMSGVLASAAAVLLVVAVLMHQRTNDGGPVAVAVAWELAVWLAVATCAAAVAFAIGRAELVVAAGIKRHRDLVTLTDQRALWTIARPGYELVVLDATQTIACSIGGRRPRVLISRTLLADLETDELEAILCHEEAHLAGFHGRLAQLAEIAAACAPWLPASRDLRRSTALLVELAADDHALRCTSSDAISSALIKLADTAHSATMVERAARTRTAARA